MLYPCSGIRFLLVALLHVARAQVQNLRFVDTDTDANEVGGSVIFDLPAAGHVNIAEYTVSFMSGCTDSSCRNGQIATGCTGPVLKATEKAGAWTTVVSLAADQDISTGCGGGGSSPCTHVVVKSIDHTGANTNQDACARIFDAPTGYGRTFYVTVSGQTNANTAKTALVSAGHVQEFFVDMEAVATAIWDSGGSSITETDYSDATPVYSLTFSTGATDTQVSTAIAGVSVSITPLPIAFTGTAASTGHGLGFGQVKSVLDEHNPIRPDPDIAKHFVRSCIRLNMAYAATVNWKGEVRLFTTSTSGTQTGIQNLADVYMGYVTLSFNNAGYGTAGNSAVSGHVTATAANCEQIDGVSGASCV